MVPYTFSVHTKGLCVMCLAEPNKTVKTAEMSVQSLNSFLKLDYGKIFNIKNLQVLQQEGEDPESETEAVDIRVTLCKSCTELRNGFCDLYAEWQALQRKMNFSVLKILEVMVKAEGNVNASRRYRQRITGSSVPVYDGEIIKTTIPEKFRKEAMKKCAFHVKKEVQKSVAPAQKPKPKVNVNNKEEELEKLELEFSDDFEDGNGEQVCNNGYIDKNDDKFKEDLISDDDDDDAMKVDEDADPEELMIRYNSFPGSSAHSVDTLSFSNCSNRLTPTKRHFEGSSHSSPEANEQMDNRTATFNSKYECEICGKVVVSLKNFELHQRRHTGEKPFACPFCDQHFRDTSNLRSHALRYHRQFLFANFKESSCTDESFKNALDKIIQSIVLMTDGEGPAHQSHQCYLCNKEYTQKYAIEDHIVQRHYDVLSTAILHLQKEISSHASEDIAQYLAQIQESGETCTICGLCGLQFNSGLEVNSHMKVHVRVKVARGQGGLKQTKTSDSLIQLKMKCNICSKYFEDLHALTKHKTLHQGNCATAASRESVYNCEHCGRSFCSYYSQRSHVLSFHRYEVFSKYLPSNTTASEIEGIVKGITGKYKKLSSGLFQCSLCQKEITQLRKLQSHMLVTHFDEVVIKLKIAIHKIHLKNGEDSGDAEPPLPQLDLFESSSGNMANFMPFDGDFNGDESMNGLYNGNEDASGNLEVVLSFPDLD